MHNPYLARTSCLAAFATITALGTALGACDGNAGERTVLRVISYPWIPDAGDDGFQRLTAHLEADFESRFPDIDLQLRPIADSFGVYEVEDDTGGPGQLVRWLTDDIIASDDHQVESGYHLVEIDTLMLDQLDTRGIIRAWPAVDTSDWHPAGQQAATIDGRLLGVPRLLCGHFVISRDPDVLAATTVDELITALQALPGDRRRLAGDFLGSWDATALYLDAWQDTYPDAPLSDAFGPDGMLALDQGVLDGMKALAQECDFADANPCIDGTYDNWMDPDRAAREFGRGEAHALMGYTERLHYVLRASQEQDIDTDDLGITSIPMGSGSKPVLFADVYVMRADCDARCQEAAIAFVSYMNAPETQEYVMMSRDAGDGSIPRYLIPATRSALTDTVLAEDPFYIFIREAIEGDIPAFPNQGFYAVKDQASCVIEESLGAAACE